MSHMARSLINSLRYLTAAPAIIDSSKLDVPPRLLTTRATSLPIIIIIRVLTSSMTATDLAVD